MPASLSDQLYWTLARACVWRIIGRRGDSFTRPSESGEVYIRPGNGTGAHFSLLWRGLSCIVFGPMVGLGVGAFLYYVWFLT